MKSNQQLLLTIQNTTEKILTRRKTKRRKAQEKAKKKGQIREWIEALLWAVAVVFLINQFLFQLYQIPTPSMEDTLLVKDRVFVNKLIYGPEIYPGGPKILEFRKPARNEIIVFENPNYITRGPLFDISARVIYMMTFSMVNIDKDESGNPRSQLYVKRAVGYPGDRIVFSKGDILIQSEGFSQFIPESDYRELCGYDFPMKRQFDEDIYNIFRNAAIIQAYSNLKEDIPEYIQNLPYTSDTSLHDYYYIYSQYYKTQQMINPDDDKARSMAARYQTGLYVPEEHILPLGDNRDNSVDGRYFGPVSMETILGKTIFKFWPLHRIGIAR